MGDTRIGELRVGRPPAAQLAVLHFDLHVVAALSALRLALGSLSTPRSASNAARQAIPKPGVAGSIPAGGTMLFLPRTSSFLLPPCRLLPNRQNCRHSADETRRHTPRRRRTRSHEGGCRGSWSSLAVGALRHPNLGVGSCAGVGSCFWGLVQTAESLLGLATVGRSVGAV